VSLRVELDLLLSSLPAAFTRRTVGPAVKQLSLIGFKRSLDLQQLKAELRRLQEREEEEMRAERRSRREQLLQETVAAQAADGSSSLQRRPHLDSPAKRSLGPLLARMSGEKAGAESESSSACCHKDCTN
jgi:hypothetical protein